MPSLQQHLCRSIYIIDNQHQFKHYIAVLSIIMKIRYYYQQIIYILSIMIDIMCINYRPLTILQMVVIGNYFFVARVFGTKCKVI